MFSSSRLNTIHLATKERLETRHRVTRTGLVSYPSRVIHSSSWPHTNETIRVTGGISRDFANLAAVQPCFTVRRRSASLSCTDNVAPFSVHCSTSLNRLRPALCLNVNCCSNCRATQSKNPPQPPRFLFNLRNAGRKTADPESKLSPARFIRLLLIENIIIRAIRSSVAYRQKKIAN